jgi:hypothetical protein
VFFFRQKLHNYTLENEQEQSRNENKQAANPDRVLHPIHLLTVARLRRFNNGPFIESHETKKIVGNNHLVLSKTTGNVACVVVCIV